MKKLVVVLTVCAMTAISMAGVTGTIDINSVTFELADRARITGAGLTNYRTSTGIYSFNTSNPTGAGIGLVDYGFCIDLHQVVGSNKTYNVQDLQDSPAPAMGDIKADYIRELWGRYFDEAWLEGGLENQRMGEAFGVAIWEIINETDKEWDVTSGSGFYATGVEKADIANDWLASLNGDTSMFNNSVVALGSDCKQDFATVPEPTTLCILGLGSMLVRRKRK